MCLVMCELWSICSITLVWRFSPQEKGTGVIYWVCLLFLTTNFYNASRNFISKRDWSFCQMLLLVNNRKGEKQLPSWHTE